MDNVLTAVPSKILPKIFGPAGEKSAPIPMADKSLDVAESAALKTTGFNTAFRDVVVETEVLDATVWLYLGGLLRRLG